MKYIFPAVFYFLLRTVICADVTLDDIKQKAIAEAELSVDEATPNEAEERQLQTGSSNSNLPCLENNMVYWSDDRQLTEASSAELCYAKCQALQWCRYFSSSPTTYYCLLLKTVVYKKQENGWTSGGSGTGCARPTVTLGDYQDGLTRGDTICEAGITFNNSEGELKLMTVKEVNHCKDLCAASSCKIWIITGTLPNGEGYKCSLRSPTVTESLIRKLKHVPGENPCTSRTLSCMEPIKYAYPPDANEDERTAAKTIFDCYNACRTNSTCKTFVFQVTGSRCFTSRDEKVAIIRRRGVVFVSGSMNCGASESTAWKGRPYLSSAICEV